MARRAGEAAAVSMFGNAPVGMPGLAVIVTSGLLFGLSVLAARRRGGPTPETAGGQRASGSWAGIAVQGSSFFVVSVGRPDIALEPLSPLALGEAAVVAALAGGAIALFVWASRTMGQNWALVARTRADHTLVTTGPFAHVRHPIYVAMFLFLTALAIGMGHGGRMLIAAPIFALGTWMRIAHEERLLRAMFGAAYDAYAGRVKRFIPGLF